MYSMLYTTTGSEDEAAKLSNHLLGKRLIACANIFQVRSLYRWEGEVNDEREFAMIMKTRTEHLQTAIQELKSIHSYDVPCIVSYRMGDAYPGYLRWIDEVTSPG